MRAPWLVLFSLAGAFAQAPAAPEVRGTVVESGTNTPIPGAEVTLREFGPNADKFIVSKAVISTITDANGAYILRPGHFSGFTLGATKEGYAEAGGRSVTLNAGASAQMFRISLTRTATLTGRVIDGRGNPVPNLRVLLEQPPGGSTPAVVSP